MAASNGNDLITQPGGLAIAEKFFRTFWVDRLGERWCAPRNANNNNNELDPYGGELINCNIFPVHTLNARWKNTETFNIALSNLSINFNHPLPSTCKLLVFTLDGNPKSRYRSLSSFNGSTIDNSSSHLTTLFDVVYTPPNLLEQDFSRQNFSSNDDHLIKISDTMFNVTPKRLKFKSVDISSRIPFEFQTLQINCHSYDAIRNKRKPLSNFNDEIDSFKAEIVVCNEAWKLVYEGKTFYNLAL